MSFQDSQALANSEVMCELSLPTEQKAGQGGGRGGIALITCWVQPEARHAGQRLERAEAEPGREGRRPANQTVTQTNKELTTWNGEEPVPVGAGGREEAQQTRLSLSQQGFLQRT